MSIHSSLKGADTLRGERSVLTRFERILKLVKDGKIDEEESSAFGLPKVRTKFKIAKPKPLAEDAPAEGAEGAEGGEGESEEAAAD